jgi:hypothetical protein
LAILQALLIERPRRAIGAMTTAARQALARVGGTTAGMARTFKGKAIGWASRGWVLLVARPLRGVRGTIAGSSRMLVHATGVGVETAGNGAGQLRRAVPTAAPIVTLRARSKRAVMRAPLGVHPRRLSGVRPATAARDSIESMLERASAARLRCRRILRARPDVRGFLEFRAYELRAHSRRELMMRVAGGLGLVLLSLAVGIAVAVLGR